MMWRYGYLLADVVLISIHNDTDIHTHPCFGPTYIWCSIHGHCTIQVCAAACSVAAGANEVNEREFTSDSRDVSDPVSSRSTAETGYD